MELSLGIRVLNNLASAKGINQRLEVHALLKTVLVTQVRHNSLGGLLSMVEGDAREEMVDDVVVNDLVEEVTADESKSSVDGGKGTLDEGPGLLVVVGNIGVSVVQVSDGNCRILVIWVHDGHVWS